MRIQARAGWLQFSVWQEIPNLKTADYADFADLENSEGLRTPENSVRENSEGQVKYCHCTFFGYATPDRAGALPRLMSVARCDMGLPAHTSHPLSRLFACFAGPIP